jgi:hypothetical protein
MNCKHIETLKQNPNYHMHSFVIGKRTESLHEMRELELCLPCLNIILTEILGKPSIKCWFENRCDE